MRSDMQQVVCETHRSYPGEKVSREKIRRWNDEDEFPSNKQGMKPKHHKYVDRRESGFRMNPLYQFLSSRVGRPWNDVWSEICGAFRKSSRKHCDIHTILRNCIAFEVTMGADGVPYDVQYGWAITSYRRGHNFYVNPDTGYLCVAPAQVTKPGNTATTNCIVFPKNKWLQYRLVAHKRWNPIRKDYDSTWMWYALELVKHPEPVVRRRWLDPPTKEQQGRFFWMTYAPGYDVFLHDDLHKISNDTFRSMYAEPNLYAVRMKQLNSKELRVVERTLNSK